MQYSQEVENMCPVAKGAYHGPAPIPEEGKWVQQAFGKTALLDLWLYCRSPSVGRLLPSTGAILRECFDVTFQS